MFVEKHGFLRASRGRIVDQSENVFVLRGMSFFWSQWIYQFYNVETVKWLKDDWAINAIRVPLAVDYGGYLENPHRETQKIITMIEAAIECDIYVIIDWHTHHEELSAASVFFSWLSRRYSKCPNIIYEIWNEPHPIYDWDVDIKPYHEELIPLIRGESEQSLIVVGSANYSQNVDHSAINQISAENIAYSIHFYAESHREKLRDKCKFAVDQGLTLLATEYGTCEATGDGKLNYEETQQWWRFLYTYDIGHFNWSIADKLETAAALLPGASPYGRWPEEALTSSGRFVREFLRTNRIETLDAGQAAREARPRKEP